MSQKKEIKIGNLTNQEIKYIRLLTGDPNMSEKRIKSTKWFLPTELTIKVQKYLERKNKLKVNK